MLSSERHQKEEMIPDRELTDTVARKTLTPSPANSWSLTRSTLEEKTDFVSEEERNTDSNMAVEAENNKVLLVEDEEKDESEEEKMAEDKMADNKATSLRGSTTPNSPLQRYGKESKRSLLKAKRARVEHIVKNITVNPSRLQVLDLSPSNSYPSKPETSHRNLAADLTKPSSKSLGKRRKEEEGSFSALSGQLSSSENCKDLENYDMEGGERFEGKRRRLGEKLIESSPNDEYTNRLDQSHSGNLSSRPLLANISSEKANSALVSAIKQEFLGVIDRIAENSTKRFLDELQKSMSDLHTFERRKHFWNSAANSDDEIQRSHSKRRNHSSESQLQATSPPFEKSEYLRKNIPNHIALQKKRVKSRDEDAYPSRHNEFYDCRRFGMDVEHSRNDPDVSNEKDGEQTEALSLVSKKTSASTPSAEAPFFIGEFPFVSEKNLSKTPENLTSVIQQRILNSFKESANIKTPLKLSRTPSPPRPSNSNLNSSGYLPDSNFHPGVTNPYRFSFNNNPLLSPNLRRESFGPSPMMKNNFPYSSSMYPQSGQGVFPFTPGHMSVPFLQTLQQQRYLAHAFADYKRMRDGGEKSSSRPNSTRTSTRDTPRYHGYSSKDRERKEEQASYMSNVGMNLHQFSASSVQEGLTPLHLKKAKIMFFYTRYPSASILKNYFPDIKFTRATTSQLIKWFSNFREFFYIQIEKFARQTLSDGVTDVEQLHVTRDSELFRVLNLHYNKCNDFKVPNEFLGVALGSLEEFFQAIQQGKDQDPSWKKPIYKVICKLDQDIPIQFKLPNVLEHLHEIV